MSHFDWATLKRILKYWTLCKNRCLHSQERIIEVPIIGNILGKHIGNLMWTHEKLFSLGGGGGVRVWGWKFIIIYFSPCTHLCSQWCSHMFPICSSSSQCVPSRTSILSHIVWPQFFRPCPYRWTKMKELYFSIKTSIWGSIHNYLFIFMMGQIKMAPCPPKINKK